MEELHLRQCPEPVATPQDWADEDIQLLLPLLWDDEDSGEHTGPTIRGGLPTAEDDRLWKAVCDYLDAGPKSAAANMTPTRMIDFPFSDCCGKFCRSAGCKEGHMNLAKDDCLFERAWVFQVEGCDCDARLILHGHSFLAWSKRSEVGVEKRADDLTSVNWRLARRDASGWKQAGAGYECLPLKKDIPWRQHYSARSQAQVTWKWREWKGDTQGFPPADLPAPGRDPEAALRLKYRRVQTLLELADAAEVVETLSLQETNKAIRSHGKIEGERDVTCFRKQVYSTAKDEHAGSSESAGHVLEENTEPNWSGLGPPADATWPFTVLFIGVGNGDKTDPDLQLTKEFNLIESAYKESALYHNANDRVHIKQIFFSKLAEVMKQIRREKPAVLHLGCHATNGKGLELFRQKVSPRDFVDAIQSWNATARRQQYHEIRLVILNACESDALARDLKSCVEFVIGHKDRVADDDAIDFSHLLYQCIFDGTALWDSFLQAKTACTGYRFFAQRDAREFQLVPPNIADTPKSPRSCTSSVSSGLHDKGNISQNSRFFEAGASNSPVQSATARAMPSGRTLFIGYRVASDADLVERLYDKLVSKGVPVWWDKKCLLPGRPWEEGFVDGLNRADVFVPVMSKKALAEFSNLTPNSPCDNVLLEHQLALELMKRDNLRRIFPVWVGELENHPHLGDIYDDFFKGNCMPNSPDVVVTAIDEKLVGHLQRMGKGAPQLSETERTVRATLKAICLHQGAVLSGVKRDAIDIVVAKIDVMWRDQGYFSFSPLAASDDATSPHDYSSLASSDCNELVVFLKSKGLGDIAEKFSKQTGMNLVKSLGWIREDDFEQSDLSFLKPWHKRQLIQLVRDSTAHCVSVTSFSTVTSFFKDAINSDSDHSRDDTATERYDTTSESGEDSDFASDAVLMKHPGNPADFQEHMGGFIADFLEYMSQSAPETATETFHVPLADGSHEWSYCMLVWMRFAQDADHLESFLQDKWFKCIKVAEQDSLLAMLDSCLNQESTKHKCWSRADFERSGCGKQFAAVIFVTDTMVRHSLHWHAESVRMWRQDVVKNWFQNGEDASAFLLRANMFLRKHLVNGISVVTLVVETQSYVAFMRMTPLATILLFGYLEARKMDDTASGAAGGRSSLFQGFRMFVSSSKQVFSLTKADVPALGAKPTVFQGLRCLARLSGEAWALLGPMKTAREYVEKKAQVVEENSDAHLKVAEEQTTKKSKKKGQRKKATSDDTIGASKADTAANPTAVSDAERAERMMMELIAEEEAIKTSKKKGKGKKTLSDEKADAAAYAAWVAEELQKVEDEKQEARKKAEDEEREREMRHATAMRERESVEKNKEKQRAAAAALSRVQIAASGKQARATGVQITIDPGQWKNILCEYHQLGRCQNGKKCNFAHGETDLQKYKTKLCTYYENGYCEKDKADCFYAHGHDDLRSRCKFHFEFSGGCSKGLLCPLSHVKDQRLQPSAQKDVSSGSTQEFGSMPQDGTANEQMGNRHQDMMSAGSAHLGMDEGFKQVVATSTVASGAIGQLYVDAQNSSWPFSQKDIWEIFAGQRDGRSFKLCNPKEQGTLGVQCLEDPSAFIVSYPKLSDADAAYRFFAHAQSTTWKDENRPEAGLHIQLFSGEPAASILTEERVGALVQQTFTGQASTMGIEKTFSIEQALPEKGNRSERDDASLSAASTRPRTVDVPLPSMDQSMDPISVSQKKSYVEQLLTGNRSERDDESLSAVATRPRTVTVSLVREKDDRSERDDASLSAASTRTRTAKKDSSLPTCSVRDEDEVHQAESVAVDADHAKPDDKDPAQDQWLVGTWDCLQGMMNVREKLQGPDKQLTLELKSAFNDARSNVRCDDHEGLMMKFLARHITRVWMIPPRDINPVQNFHDSEMIRISALFPNEDKKLEAGSSLWLCKQLTNSLAEYWARYQTVLHDEKYRMLTVTLAKSKGMPLDEDGWPLPKSQGDTILQNHSLEKLLTSSDKLRSLIMSGVRLQARAEIVDFYWSHEDEVETMEAAEHLLELDGKLYIGLYDYYEADQRKINVKSMGEGYWCEVKSEFDMTWRPAVITRHSKRSRIVRYHDGRYEEIKHAKWQERVRERRPNIILYGPKIDFPAFNTDENIKKFKDALVSVCQLPNISARDVEILNIIEADQAEEAASVNADHIMVQKVKEGFVTFRGEQCVIVESSITFPHVLEDTDKQTLKKLVTVDSLSYAFDHNRLAPPSDLDLKFSGNIVKVTVEMPVRLPNIEMKSYGYVGEYMHAVENILMHERDRSIANSIAIPSERKDEVSFQNLHADGMSMRLTMDKNLDFIRKKEISADSGSVCIESRALSQSEDFRFDLRQCLALTLGISKARVTVARITQDKDEFSSYADVRVQGQQCLFDNMRRINQLEMTEIADRLQEAIKNPSSTITQSFSVSKVATRYTVGSGSGLNADQLAAINSIRHDISGIQGPPGTGKSYMIAQILIDYIPHEKTLVACVQNKAVDALVSKLAEDSADFLVLGARNEKEQHDLQRRSKLNSETLRYTAYALTRRDRDVREYAKAKALAILDRTRSNIMFKTASGLSWKNIGARKPKFGGGELTNVALANALKSKTSFTHQEWDSFGISHLNYDNFIKSGDSYFSPQAQKQQKAANVTDSKESKRGAAKMPANRYMMLPEGEDQSEEEEEEEIKEEEHETEAGEGQEAPLQHLPVWSKITSELLDRLRKHWLLLKSWDLIVYSLLHRDVSEKRLLVVERRTRVVLSTVDSTQKALRMLEQYTYDTNKAVRLFGAIILDEAGCVPEWKMPALTRFNPKWLIMVKSPRVLLPQHYDMPSTSFPTSHTNTPQAPPPPPPPHTHKHTHTHTHTGRGS
jgi:hypothetical protein